MRIAADKLMEAIRILLQAMGAQDQEARLVATVLVEADMRGIHTHGCASKKPETTGLLWPWSATPTTSGFWAIIPQRPPPKD
ncbi:MAG: hypothetical protein P8X90_27555 [Desulfobacterales bacterium]